MPGSPPRQRWSVGFTGNDAVGRRAVSSTRPQTGFDSSAQPTGHLWGRLEGETAQDSRETREESPPNALLTSATRCTGCVAGAISTPPRREGRPDSRETR